MLQLRFNNPVVCALSVFLLIGQPLFAVKKNDLSGIVVGADGEPVKKAIVSIVVDGEKKEHYTNKKGKFKFKRIPEGEYTINVSHEEQGTAELYVIITADKDVGTISLSSKEQRPSQLVLLKLQQEEQLKQLMLQKEEQLKQLKLQKEEQIKQLKLQKEEQLKQLMLQQEQAFSTQLDGQKNMQFDNMHGPYENSGFTDFFADGNNYFLWNKKDSKRGMYRSVDSGENWEKMTWDGIKYVPSNVYKYDGEYLFQYTTEDNSDGVWNSYDYDKKVWSFNEIDEFELKIFNAEKNNWEKEFNSQKSKKFPIMKKRRELVYKDYKYNILLPFNKWWKMSYREREKYSDGKIKPLLDGTIYERDNDVFVLNTYGLFKLMTESDIQSSSNYNKMIHDNFVECKSYFESDIKSQLKLEEIIKRYRETKNTIEERKIIHKDLKQELIKEYDWLKKMKDWQEDPTIKMDNKSWSGLTEEERKQLEIEYKKRINNYNELDYNLNQIIEYLETSSKWLNSTENEIDSLKKLITNEVRSFPMFYPVPANGINPSEISDIRSKNDTLFVLTSFNNGSSNKLFLYDGQWHTVFDPFINDMFSDYRLSIEMLDNIDNIIFISPSKKAKLPNNIYYLNRVQDISIENKESEYQLLPYRDKTGSIIDYAYTDKSGKLWTIEKNNPRVISWNYGHNSVSTGDYQLYRYKSMNDYSDPLLIQEWKPYISPDKKDRDYREGHYLKMGKYNPESHQPAYSSIKLVKTEDSKIYFIKDNTIKQIGAGRDKDFIFKYNILSSIGARISISDSLVNYTFFPYKNDIIMFNYFDHLYRERESYAFERKIVPILTNFFHIQIGVNKGVNQNITSTPYSLIKQLNRLINLNSEADNTRYNQTAKRVQLFRPNSSGNLLYTLDSLGTLKSLFEKREINQFVDEEFLIDSKLKNGYNKYGHTQAYYHEGGRGNYKIRCTIGNNDEFLVYNYPNNIKYLRNGELKTHPAFTQFDNIKVSIVSNNNNKYLIGTYGHGLFISK